MELITFITGNASKAEYLSRYFDMPVEHIDLDLPEIQSLDLEAVVRDKAARAFEIVKKPVLVEDVSLAFNSLNGLPGPLIKWFLHSLGNEGLCKLADRHADRSAECKVMFGLADYSGIHIFEGKVEGMIASKPKGAAGFGWDPIFIPLGHDKTRGEMNDQEKHESGMRRIALEKLKTYLAKQVERPHDG